MFYYFSNWTDCASKVLDIFVLQPWSPIWLFSHHTTLYCSLECLSTLDIFYFQFSLDPKDWRMNMVMKFTSLLIHGFKQVLCFLVRTLTDNILKLFLHSNRVGAVGSDFSSHWFYSNNYLCGQGSIPDWLPFTTCECRLGFWIPGSLVFSFYQIICYLNSCYWTPIDHMCSVKSFKS